MPDGPEAGRSGFRRAEAFFGRRKTQGLGARKAALIADVLPRLRVDVGAPPPADLRTLFAPQVESVHLEIGFGGGEHLAARAVAEPTTGFVGAEAFVNGVAKLVGLVEDEVLQNVRVHDEDAAPLLDWLPEGGLERIDLLYPDPWPKARHHKRRFVNARNLARIARALAPGATFRFASDWPDYVNWTLEHVAREPTLSWTAQRARDWHEPWDGWHRTRYESKALREGRRPAYLVFRKG